MKLVNCPCGKEPFYAVHPNYKGIGSHSVACHCGIVMIGGTEKVGKKAIMQQWNNTFSSCNKKSA